MPHNNILVQFLYFCSVKPSSLSAYIYIRNNCCHFPQIHPLCGRHETSKWGLLSRAVGGWYHPRLPLIVTQFSDVRCAIVARNWLTLGQRTDGWTGIEECLPVVWLLDRHKIHTHTFTYIYQSNKASLFTFVSLNCHLFCQVCAAINICGKWFNISINFCTA